ncbi:hypothetical protein KTN05_10920 [Paracoccus sp. Z118]|uniref:hypothetical protein n=1 Tax=Paracoccus sp. Z118 TaxID=2851017 RepID=UPI001C2BBE76|nr:hypothetical protein [Paracoccus sp. Z118]MBV0892363.1 hypothetical protein [Paracoccus sp. Z118]
MPGKHLARWTLSWFASALSFLLAALALAVPFAPAPGAWLEGRGLALVHLLALGWLSQMMIGASLQFLPVLLARPLPWPWLSPLSLALTGVGTILLALGFIGLEGGGTGLLALAPLPLGAGLGLFLLMAGGTLLPAGGWRDDAGRPVLLALAALILTFASGGGMALAGTGGPVAISPEALPFHVGLGVAGWLGLATAGVSYRLFAMFLIAPDGGGRLRRITAGAALCLTGLLTLGLGLAGHWPAPGWLLPAAMICASVTAGLYIADIAQVWRSRRRARPEVNMRMTRPALAFLALAALLAPVAAIDGRFAEAAVFAALVGWLSGLTLAQMVKITSFLTWIQVFSPRIGKQKLPQVHELVDDAACRRWLGLWFAGAALGTAALLAEHAQGLRLAFAVLLVAALGIAREVRAIRRLAHLSFAARPPVLPPLFLPQLRMDPT